MQLLIPVIVGVLNGFINVIYNYLYYLENIIPGFYCLDIIGNEEEYENDEYEDEEASDLEKSVKE